MIYSAKNLTVCAYWYDRPMRGYEFLDQARSFLKRIVAALPELSTLKVVRDPKESNGLIENNFSNFDQEVIAALPADWVFVDPSSENKKFTRDSTAATSFPGSFFLSSSDGMKELSIRMSAGTPHKRSSNSIIVEFSFDVENFEIVESILEICVDFWRPHNAFVGRTQVQRMLNQPVGSVRIGWLTYLADASAYRYVPNDIRWENLFSGILIYSSEKPGHEDDALGIENMRRILDALSPHGILKGHSKPVA